MKRLLSLILVALGLAASAALAQNQAQDSAHDFRTETCNMEVNAGFAGRKGDGPNGELAVKIYINANYKMEDFEEVKKEFVSMFVSNLNATATEKGYTTRFYGVDFDSKGKFNFLIFVNAYFDQNTKEYFFVYDVHGWGKHHLFTYATPSSTNTIDAINAGIKNLPSYFENGWSCGTLN